MIALCTAEAELMGLNTAAAESIFVRNILEDMGFVDVPIHIYGDSSAALGAINREGAGKMKHIHVRQLWLQQMLREKRLKVFKISTEENVADLMTKHLSAKRKLLFTMRGSFAS